jgi:hypothetical protein
MKNEHKNKFTSLAGRAALIVLIAIGPFLLSCAKEDTEPRGTQQFLYGKRWRLASATVNERGQEVADVIPACRQDDALEFKEGQVLLYHNGPNKCLAEADVETGVWSLNAQKNILTTDQVEYQVVSLTATRMELKQELVGVDGKVTKKSFYTAE